MKNKKAEEYKLKFLESELERVKQRYETYLKVLIKYKLPETAYAAIMYDELYHDMLLKYMEDGGKFTDFIFGNNKTPIDKINSEIKNYETLIKLIIGKITMFDDKTKREIVDDAITYKKLWLEIPNPLGKKKCKQRKK